MTPLIVIDPALGRTGAHNLAFAGLLADLPAEDGELGVCGNVAMDADLRQRLAARCGLVAPLFDHDFYALAGKVGGISEHWDWIHALARGYEAALERVLARWPNQPVRLLYHTLSWEHASALALALREVGERGAALQHVALLMYSPGVDEDGGITDLPRRLNFRLAFGALVQAGNVVMQAGCREYSRAYRHLLGLDQDLPLHPCFIADWSLPRVAPAPSREQVVLLYLGEIKQDKGFLELPARLRRELAAAGPARRFVLQFAAIRTEAARAVVDELRVLAAGDARVEIHEGFLPQPQLDALLASASVLHLDYDARAYAHKSSGLLWLAAWHGLAVTLPAGTWLEREAKRLGVAIIAPGASSAAGAVAARPRRDEDYFRAIFTPLRDWLAGLPSIPPVATSAVPVESVAATRPVRPAGGPGVDVVVFWKQNDSTLYGRRVDMVARYLASRPDVRRVLVLDAPIDEERRAALAASTDAARHDRRVGERVLDKLAGRCDVGKIVYSLFLHPRDGYGPDEQDRPGPGFLAAYENFLRAEFARWGIAPERAVFWIYPRAFAAAALLARLRPRQLVVDVVDDHRAWPGLDVAEKERLTAHYRELLAAADLALANCAPVRDAMATLGPAPRLVPNGCDLPLPVRLDETDDALREQLAFTGRTLGFVGNLEAKIDIDLLSRLADVFPECRLVLIGSTHANPGVLALRRHANVRLPGVVPYDRLGAWLSTFDVGLIPHRQMELTHHMNPLKAYVYLANGIPAVATSVPNIEPLPGLLEVADDVDGFIAAVRSLLARPRPAQADFDAATRTRSWAARLGPAVDALLQARTPT